MGLKIPALLDAILEATAAEASAKARIATLRATLEDEARRRFVEEGAAPSWNAPKLGKVRFDPPGELTAAVAESAVWSAWVAEQYPTEVTMVLEVESKDADAAVQALRFAGIDPKVTRGIRPAWSGPFLEGLDVEEDTTDDGQMLGPATYTVADPASGEVIPGLTAHRSPGKLVVSLDLDRRTLALEDARAQAAAILSEADPDAPDLAELAARRRELEGMPAEVLSAYAGRLELGKSGTKAELAERIARTEARTGRRELLTAATMGEGPHGNGSTMALGEAIGFAEALVEATTEDHHETEEEATAQALRAPSVAGILTIGSREALRRFAKAHGVPAHGTKQDLAIRLSASGKTVDAITRWVEDNTTQEPTP